MKNQKPDFPAYDVEHFKKWRRLATIGAVPIAAIYLYATLFVKQDIMWQLVSTACVVVVVALCFIALYSLQIEAVRRELHRGLDARQLLTSIIDDISSITNSQSDSVLEKLLQKLYDPEEQLVLLKGTKTGTKWVLLRLCTNLVNNDAHKIHNHQTGKDRSGDELVIHAQLRRHDLIRETLWLYIHDEKPK